MKNTLTQYKINNNGCWIWTGARRGTYGVVSRTPAHHLLYEFHKGKIPDNLQLDHLCRVHLCVNPDHLEAVSSGENTRRGNLFRLGRETLEAMSKELDLDIIAAISGVSSSYVHFLYSQLSSDCPILHFS